MYYIKAEDKCDGIVKVFKEKTMKEAEKLAAPLRKNFNIEIFEVKEQPTVKTKFVKKFVLTEQIPGAGCYFGEEEYVNEPVGIFDKKPSDELVFFYVLNRAQKEYGKKIALTRSFEKHGRQLFSVFDNEEGHQIGAYIYFVKEYSLISD